jgi:hypothetical protein
VNNIDYRGYRLNWQECFETVTCAKGDVKKKHFVHITDLPLNQKNIVASSYSGRLRWKIENEGFNSLKNGGYGLKHKWTLTSYQGLKNYFQFMQMGHLINQLMVKSRVFQETFMQEKNHPTLKSLWKDLSEVMNWINIKGDRLAEISATRIHNALSVKWVKEMPCSRI